jgi:ABC-type sulfate transport system permease subunit
MDFDEKYLFGIVMSYTLSEKNFHHKILMISLLNLAPKLKFAENRQGT